MVILQEQVVSGDEIAVGVNGRRGRVRVRTRRWMDADSIQSARRLVECALSEKNVIEVRAYCAQGSIEIFFDQQTISAPQLLTQLAQRLTECPSAPAATNWALPGCLIEPIGSGLRLRKTTLDWTIVESRPGRLVATHPELCADRQLRRQFAQQLGARPTIRKATPGWYRTSIGIQYDPDRMQPADVARLLRQLTAELLRVEDQRLATALQTEQAHGIRRRVYRVLAVSNLGLTFAALATPVVPTPPFLIAAIYFAIRSSTHLQRWLEETRLLGRLAHEWQNYQAVRSVVKFETIVITIAVTGAFVLLVEMAPAQLTAVGIITAAEVVAVVLLPSLKLTHLDKPHDSATPANPPLLAIPSVT